MEKRTLIKVLPIKRNVKINGVDAQFTSLIIFYRDENGIKKSEFIDRTESSYYLVKPEYVEDIEHPPLFISENKVEKITTKTDLLFRDIATRTGSFDYFDKFRGSEGERSSTLKNLFKHPRVYNADMDVCDRYIADFHSKYNFDKDYKLHKAFYDIEVDLLEGGLDTEGYIGFPDEEVAPCPISIITLIDEHTLDVYNFILRNKNNKSLIDFEKNINQILPEAKEFVKETTKCEVHDIFPKFFDNEEDLIIEFFKKLHEINPDYCCAWNQHYDLITIINRLQKVAHPPKGTSLKDYVMSIVNDSNYNTYKDSFGNEITLQVNPFYSSREETKIVDRMDYFINLDGIQMMDQMLIYANIRKSTIKDSYSLDAIAEEELGDRKQEFGPGETIKNLAHLNFKKFYFYNIKDVLLLVLLERKNLDIDMIQRLSEITNTRNEKVLKKTISIKNFINKFALDSGFVMGDNKNAEYGRDSELYKKAFNINTNVIETDPLYKQLFDVKDNYGAFVSDPNLNNPNGIKLFGKLSKFIYEYVFDEDFSALYPSIIRAFNLSVMTEVGKFYISDNEIENKLINEYGYSVLLRKSENLSASDAPDDLGIVLADTIQSEDWLRLGSQFMDLPSVEEMINELNETIKEA